MLKLNIDYNKHINFIKNFDEKNIKSNKKFLKLLLKNNNFKNFLLDDIRFCYYFCHWVIEGRCEVLEDIFVSNSCYALNYAAFVLNSKLPENLHNCMILKHLSEKDECANQYFIWLLNKENKINIGVWGDYK